MSSTGGQLAHLDVLHGLADGDALDVRLAPQLLHRRTLLLQVPRHPPSETAQFTGCGAAACLERINTAAGPLYISQANISLLIMSFTPCFHGFMEIAKLKSEV